MSSGCQFVVSGGSIPIFWAPPFQRPPHKRKGGQVRFSNDQTMGLENKFDSQKYLSPHERKHMAKSLQLSERQVAIFRPNTPLSSYAL